MSECVLNVLRDNLKLAACQKMRLQKFKLPLRALTDKRVPISTKKRLINQRRGFLVLLLTFLFSSKVLRALTPSGHNDPVRWDVDNCDKKTRNIFFTSLLH